MRNRKLEVITCPHCQREYLPVEIFIPKYFFGSPKEIERDYSGKIIDFVGTSVDNMERYICDNCGKPLKIYANMKFNVIVEDTLDFTEDYRTSLKKKELLEFPED